VKRTTLVDAMAEAMSAAKDLAASGRAKFLEIFSGMQRFQRHVYLANPKRRRGLSALTASKERGRRQSGRVRLGRASGLGSINALADGLYLARTGQWAAAADMLVYDYPALSARYRRYAEEGVDRDELQHLSVSFPFTKRLAP
jgi:hypothetical protein